MVDTAQKPKFSSNQPHLVLDTPVHCQACLLLDMATVSTSLAMERSSHVADTMRGEEVIRRVTSLMGPPGASTPHFSTPELGTLVYLVNMIFFFWEENIPIEIQQS